jgi:FkbM family methyltransferase
MVSLNSEESRMLRIRTKKWIRRIFSGIIENIPHGRISFSQEGEDLVLARVFDVLGVKKGFFVDIGAHHPFRFSNTYYFYRRGWIGMNIDARPGTKKLFEYHRAKDINIECGVGLEESVLTYYSFNEPALNTFSYREAQIKESAQYKVIDRIQIPVFKLKDILDKNLPKGKKIDFMSIDVEGFDYEVVCSNDWLKYRPTIIAIELLNVSIESIKMHPTAEVLFKNNYKFIAKTHNTLFFSL